MSVHYDVERGKYVVHWREDGRQRKRRFDSEARAEAFDWTVHDRRAAPVPKSSGSDSRGDGIYPYATSAGERWRFVFRQSDGRLSSRRGFTSRREAATARRRMVESIDRGELKISRQTFGHFWSSLSDDKSRYLTPGAHQDFANHGRKRLLPTFGEMRISDIDETAVRKWLGAMMQRIEAGELAPKTVNNARTCLSVALKEAVRQGLLVANPCDAVRQLPVDRKEFEYLRLPEISLYLDAAPPHYEALAEFLIGTGARISEALAIRTGDLALDEGLVRIYRQRSASASGTVPTKGKRFRPVQIGPGLARTLQRVVDSRPERGRDQWLFVCPIPRRGRYAGRTTDTPPNRRTVHEATLEDAGLRDMPLHALRHTAAAAWLTTGRPLIFVQRQLGHRSITTTEEHYGHLEPSFLKDAAAAGHLRPPAHRWLLTRGKGHAAVHRTGIHGGPSPRLVCAIAAAAFVFGSAVLIAEFAGDDQPGDGSAHSARVQPSPTPLT